MFEAKEGLREGDLAGIEACIEEVERLVVEDDEDEDGEEGRGAWCL